MDESKVNSIIDEITDLLDKLDLDFMIQIMAVIDAFLPRITLLDKLPGALKVFIVPIFANTFMHQIVDVLNGTKYDSRGARTVCLKWTRKLFGLTTWEPKWLYLPFEQTVTS
jgi:hypothetical protein